jgi:hypothetical protein
MKRSRKKKSTKAQSPKSPSTRDGKRSRQAKSLKLRLKAWEIYAKKLENLLLEPQPSASSAEPSSPQDVEGNLHVYAPKSGAICEGGLLAGYRGDFPVLGIDGQLLYYKAWGLNVGVNALVRGRMLPRAYVGVSYALPIEALSNTSVLVGIDTSKEVVLGLRVRL